MSNNYFITNLLNIKDENLNFSDGLYHKVIKGVTYTILTAKLEYSNQVCPHCGSNHNLIKYGFKLSTVRCSRAGDHPVLIQLKKQKMLCKSCNKYFLCYPSFVRDKVKTVCIDMYSPYISIIKELFVNAEIIIDRFHIVKLFTNSFNHTRIDTMKAYSPSNIKYKRLKKYWEHFLKPYKLLDPIHFLSVFISLESLFLMRILSILVLILARL